jgi:RNA polymerase sigma-70 factor (ECF subfamily)
MEQFSDTYHIERVRNGEISAFAHLIDKYSRQVHALIFKLIRNREDAEELAQDVFIKAFRALHTFKGQSTFSTWIYRIAYNTAISETRKRKIEYLAIDDAQIENVSEEKIDELMGRCDESEQIKKLEIALAQLPPDENALIHLFYMEDKSIEEIVQITALTASNAKTRLHRIRKKLLVILNKMEEQE